MTDDVIKSIENIPIYGRKFMKGYRMINLFVNTNSLLGSKNKIETITSFMALYFDSEIQDNYYDEFGLPFKEKFPNEYEKLMDELNKLK